LGHLQTCIAQDGMSASPLIADIIGRGRDVRYGSFADIPSPRQHVRFTPESGHQCQRPASPLRAKADIWQLAQMFASDLEQTIRPRGHRGPIDTDQCQIVAPGKSTVEVRPGGAITWDN
jgi:hypothetical protein